MTARSPARPRAWALLLPLAAIAAGCGTPADTVRPAPACDFDAMAAAAVPAVPGRLAVDRFVVTLGPGGAWTVTHGDEPDRELFRLPAAADLAALRGRLQVAEGQGAARVTESIDGTCAASFPASVRHDGRNLVLAGALGDGDAACAGLRWEARVCSPAPHHLAIDLRADGGVAAALRFRVAVEAGERVVGLGEQFRRDTLDLAGSVVPVVSREQGIGRGEPAVSAVMEALSPGASGDEDTTYHPVPHVLTSRARSFLLEDDGASVFDLSVAGRVEVRAWQDRVRVRVLHGTSPLELIERLTEVTGRMREPPAWLDEGAVVALARDPVEGAARLDALRAAGARVAAVWNQTWCGTARTVLGEQVLWNWSLPPSRQAAWDAFVDRVAATGTRVLCYVNPMLRDLPADADPATRNLYREAVERGLVVRDASGNPYLLRQGVFEVALVDLSNPDARAWMKAVLKDELLGRARCSGWMADFAEALPFDAVLASGEPAAAWHNRYPVEWARLNREALDEAGVAGGTLVFHRSGFTRTPAWSGMQWEGDQTVTWDRYDGLASALHGLLAGGFSGIALNHSDAGGYTVVPLSGTAEGRTAELLMRWVEANAFTAMLRTHEGNQPDASAQVYSDDASAAHFARCTRIHRALAPYRRTLFGEAANRGTPVVRHLAMHWPDVPRAWDVHDQFLLGPDVLVAPVLEPSTRPDGRVDRVAWLPPGTWRDLWTGAITAAGDGGVEVTVPSAPGRPPVFLRDGAASVPGILASLRAEGLEVP